MQREEKKISSRNGTYRWNKIPNYSVNGIIFFFISSITCFRSNLVYFTRGEFHEVQLIDLPYHSAHAWKMSGRLDHSRSKTEKDVGPYGYRFGNPRKLGNRMGRKLCQVLVPPNSGIFADLFSMSRAWVIELSILTGLNRELPGSKDLVVTDTSRIFAWDIFFNIK